MIINYHYKMFSARQTKQFAGFLAKEILTSRKKRKNALVLALTGNLGAGKTTFVQGFLRAAGIKKKITSPTFILVKSYKVKSYKVYHIDCYRIGKSIELLNLELKEILNNPQNIVLIEWPERISAKGGSASGGKNILPKDSIWIKFEYGKKENERIIQVN